MSSSLILITKGLDVGSSPASPTTQFHSVVSVPQSLLWASKRCTRYFWTQMASRSRLLDWLRKECTGEAFITKLPTVEGCASGHKRLDLKSCVP